MVHLFLLKTLLSPRLVKFYNPSRLSFDTFLEIVPGNLAFESCKLLRVIIRDP